MKYMYKEHVVEITTTCKNYHVEIARFDEPYGAEITPIVEIATQNGLQSVLATTDSFPTVEQAEQHGMEMARKWIEEHLLKRLTTKHGPAPISGFGTAPFSPNTSARRAVTR